MINSYKSGAGWQSAMMSSLSDLRSLLDAESLKLSSGLKAGNYSDLGAETGASLKLRASLESLSTYSEMISNAQSEINITAQYLSSIGSLVDMANSGSLSFAGGSDATARTTAKSSLQSQFSSLISYLRTPGASGYIFGGSVSTLPPVEDVDTLMNGKGSQAGLMTLFDERYAADAGANRLGRLNIAASGNSVRLSEEASGLPFGLKLGSIQSSLTNATITQAAGTPPTEQIEFSGQPSVGDNVIFNFTMPDGTTSSVTLRVAAAAGAGQFVVGATPAETALNLQNALRTSITGLVNSDLLAASSAYTAKNFFASNADHPPERVSGTPPETATTVVAGTAANTVIWYNGKFDSGDPRADRSMKIGDDISIDFGVRANEKGIQAFLSGLASSFMVTRRFSTDETTAAAQMVAMRQRAAQALTTGKVDNQATVTSIVSAQNLAKQIDTQNKSVKTLMQERLMGIEGIDAAETATTISSLTTQLQSSYQVTSRLLNLTLAAYL